MIPHPRAAVCPECHEHVVTYDESITEPAEILLEHRCRNPRETLAAWRGAVEFGVAVLGWAVPAGGLLVSIVYLVRIVLRRGP